MELRHLRYFAAVAETLNFGRAAARLSISQPPLSRQIQSLEHELGTPLFTRTTRGVRLTAAGRALIPEARRLLREAAALVEGARHLAEGGVGSLRIGFISTASYNVLPRVLPEFHRRRPGIQLALQETTSDAQIALLRDYELDVGVLVPPVVDAGFRYLPLMQEPLLAALPARRRQTTRACASSWGRSIPINSTAIVRCG